MRSHTISYAFRASGIRGLCSHIVGRLIGLPDYLRPASTIDFRSNELRICDSVENTLLKALFLADSSEIRRCFLIAQSLLEDDISEERGTPEFPERWNSGTNLRLLMSTLILVTKPDYVFETGTANGSSADAICRALTYNEKGILYSFDIVASSASLVKEKYRARLQLIQIEESPDSLTHAISTLNTPRGFGMFLHDSDHSYLGQNSDYEIALQNNFDILVSDDIDASLAFVNFAKNLGVALLDSPKIVGILDLRKLHG